MNNQFQYSSDNLNSTSVQPQPSQPMANPQANASFPPTQAPPLPNPAVQQTIPTAPPSKTLSPLNTAAAAPSGVAPPTAAQPPVTQATTPVQTPVPVQSDAGQTVRRYKDEESKSGLPGWVKPSLIIASVALLLSGVLGGGGYYLHNQEKQYIQSSTRDLLSELETLQNEYAAIVTFIKQVPDEPTQEEDASAMVLGAFDAVDSEDEDATASALQAVSTMDVGQVLGLEDSPMIKHSREYIEKLRMSEKTLTAIENASTDVGEAVSNSRVFMTLNSDLNPPFEQTSQMVHDSKALLAYLREMESLGIELATAGFEVGTAVEEAIYRAADEASIQKLEGKIQAVEALKSKAQAIDTSALDAETVAEHQAFITSFDTDLKPFYDLSDALKNKDIVALENALVSLTADVYTAGETSMTEHISFWQENKTLRSLDSVLGAWEQFDGSLSN